MSASISDGARRAEEEMLRLRLRGPLTASTAARVRGLIRCHANAGVGCLLVDLEDVTAVDAPGIAALLEGQRLLAATAPGAMFLRLNPMVEWALRRSGTIGAFRLWEAPLPVAPSAGEPVQL